jgi:hypothetical protein
MRLGLLGHENRYEVVAFQKKKIQMFPLTITTRKALKPWPQFRHDIICGEAGLDLHKA